MCRWKKHSDFIENVVVELKNPKVKIGKKELDQVEVYLRTILNTPEFNATTNSTWSFFLIGNEFSKKDYESKPYIQSKIDSYKGLGEKSLAAHESDLKYKVYVKTWSEIFNEFELSHDFLLKSLEVERAKLVNYKNADEVVENISRNTAIQSSQVEVNALD